MAESKGVIRSQPESATDQFHTEGLLQTTKSVQNETSAKTDINNFPGSAVLQQLSTLEVEQRLDTLEVCLGWTRNNRYCVYSEAGEQIFYVYEASVCFNRQLTGALRPLALKVSLCDEDQEDALVLNRPGACSSRCCWACCNLQHMEVHRAASATGAGPQLLATMEEVWSCCIPHYRLTDGQGETMWQVRGGACHCRCCCCQLEFQFVNRDGEELASITRSCQGCKEIIGAANKFTIHFSGHLTPQEKLIVLGSSFLVDLNYFEKQNKCW